MGGVLTVLEIMGHLMGDVRGTTAYSHDLHIFRCYLTQEYIYGLGVEISVLFGISGPSCLSVTVGDETTMNGHDLHTIRCYLTQETRIYMV
jgi:hypothetical protein